ncbi:hypothetical protein BGZ92_000616 [Podila epicladia]|nr:hypothetical protein BGZ92_000616 [Podila epicladia]
MDLSWPDKSTAGVIHDPYRRLENIDTKQIDPEDSDHDDFEDMHDEDDDEPDPVYVAHILRRMGASWATSAQYATHRLIVSTENSAVSYHLEFPGISQFLIPASAVFRDFLAINHDPGHTTGISEHLPEEQRQRLSCLRYTSFPAVIHGHPAQPLPIWPSPEHRQGVFHEPQKVPSLAPSSGKEKPMPVPVLELAIPYPEHFQPLLRVMYDLEIDPWAATFTPATIGPITANVARLECSTDITLRCLEYYRQIRSSQANCTLSVQGDREDLERLYQLAAMNGLLSQSS